LKIDTKFFFSMRPKNRKYL